MFWQPELTHKSPKRRHEGTKDQLCPPENVVQTLSAPNTFVLADPARAICHMVMQAINGHTSTDVKKVPTNGNISHVIPIL